MISEKAVKNIATVLLLIFISCFSAFVLADRVPGSQFFSDSVESLENSNDTVMNFAAVTLGASVAITIMPDDLATPIAQSLADMNGYFVIILTAIFLEKLIVQSGVKAIFLYVIPAISLIYLLGFASRSAFIKRLSRRLYALAICLVLIIPISTFISDKTCSTYMEYVNTTIDETQAGTDKINEISQSGDSDETIFEQISDKFQTAVSGMSDLLNYFKNMLKKCMYSIAILIVTTCAIPVLVIMLFIWLIRSLFQTNVSISDLSLFLVKKEHNRQHDIPCDEEDIL